MSDRSRHLVSARFFIATIGCAFGFGFAAGAFMPLPGLEFERDEALVFTMFCVLVSAHDHLLRVAA